ncbi:GTPase Era [Lutibaculum baratangense]|nr:GTPase Era [Lutibaculum baratangense]
MTDQTDSQQPEANTPDDPEHGDRRCGFAALIGAPNAGKSTLLNQLVGEKVSIVTHKVQTTRTLVRGIAMHGNSQVIFVDTPGIFRPRRRLDSAMLKTAWSGAKDADLVVLLIDVRKAREPETMEILERLADVPIPRLLCLNKIDTVKRDTLLEIVARLNAQLKFEATFMISALTGDGCADLLEAVAKAMPPGPWLYPEDQVSDYPVKQLAAEITREKLFIRLHEELPYESMVETEQWKPLKDGSLRVEQVIYVARDSQRGIVLGKKGQMIKEIGAQSRRELEEILERKVHLFLFVKVREKWSDDPERYREMGLEFPTD